MGRYAAEILNLINLSDSHMTAEQIFFALKAAQSKISLASVYNNLNALSKNGLIRKISMDGEADRYDKRARHDHLVCSVCGRLADCDLGDMTEEIKAKLNSDIVNYDLKIFYVCSECKNKK